MDRFFGAEGLAELLVGPVGDYLVEVHVRLGTGAGLPHDEGEVLIQGPRENLITDLGDEAGFFLWENAQVGIGEGGGFFGDSEGVDQLFWHAVAPDLEVLQGALGLSAPEFIFGDGYFA
jgi:hypothetical protein